MVYERNGDHPGRAATTAEMVPRGAVQDSSNDRHSAHGATANRRAQFPAKLSIVKRLRLTGKLPCLPHRPPMIDAADLVAYRERGKRRAVEQAAEQSTAPTVDADAIRQRARTKALRRRLRAR